MFFIFVKNLSERARQSLGRWFIILKYGDRQEIRKGCFAMMDAQKLIAWFQQQGKAAIAFSGGVDSTFLLACAKQALGGDVKAYTCRSAFVPEWELNEAREFCKKNKIDLQIIPLDVLADEKIAENPINRCYLCKKSVFGAIIAQAKQDGFPIVCDGANVDDLSDYRPGSKAAKELGVLSPLQMMGYDKAAIRKLSADMGLPTAQKPAYACLATRIPTNHAITAEALKRIDEAEQVFHAMGYPAVRVRHHGDLARVELSKESMHAFIQNEDMETVADRIKAVGYRYVALDMQGYKTGNMNIGKEPVQ